MGWLNKLFGSSVKSEEALKAAKNKINELTAMAMVNLEDGSYISAESRLKKAMAISEKTFGVNDLEVAKSLDWLATLYIAKKEHTKANQLFDRERSILQLSHIKKEEHDVAYSLNLFVAWLMHKNLYTKAEPLLESLLSIQENSLGPDHFVVSGTLSQIAVICTSKQEFVKAESLYKRVVAIREKTLGPNHPDVASALTILEGIQNARREANQQESTPNQNSNITSDISTIRSILQKIEHGEPTTFTCYGNDKQLFMLRLASETAFTDMSHIKCDIFGVSTASGDDSMIITIASIAEHTAFRNKNYDGGPVEQLEKRMFTQKEYSLLRPVKAYSNYAFPGYTLVSLDGFNRCVEQLRTGNYIIVPPEKRNESDNTMNIQ
jgi:Tfp pilus assembly protein PilF